LRRAALLLVPLIGLVAVLLARLATAARAPTAVVELQGQYRRDLDRVDTALTALAAESTPAELQAGFRRARLAYKRVEYLVEFYSPSSALSLNGAPLPRIDEDDPRHPIPATGFQVIETALFPSPSPASAAAIRPQLDSMMQVIARLRVDGIDTAAGDADVLEAMRLEIARISTLGLAGFDASLSRDGLRESAEALRGVTAGLGAYAKAAGRRGTPAWDSLRQRLSAASARLDAAPDFEGFDRLGFITENANPIAATLTELQHALGVRNSVRPRAWSRSGGIFDRGAFDPYFFAPPEIPPLLPARVALGQQLFFDVSLSRRGARSCATCHQSALAFTDGRARAQVDPGRGPVRNTPTLLNAALQPSLFGDGRARYLEDQIELVLANPREMNLPLPAAVARLSRRADLVARFSDAFELPRDQAVTEATVQNALASFVRSLPAMSSRFDQALWGDTTAISPEERRGFNLFMGKAGCGTCHFAPLFSGAFPPVYRESEPEVIGVPSRPGRGRGSVDPDPGAFDFDHAAQHLHAFKTPSLRNVARTAPYMHNGVYRSLDEVVDFYDGGGGAGLGMKLPNQTLPPDSLGLSRQDKRDLIAFMRALTDSSAASSPLAAH
jgi:cytochrome c peroxidase